MIYFDTNIYLYAFLSRIDDESQQSKSIDILEKSLADNSVVTQLSFKESIRLVDGLTNQTIDTKEILEKVFEYTSGTPYLAGSHGLRGSLILNDTSTLARYADPVDLKS
ncbi:MAG: hypothetical protein DRG30_08110 [Epsilonproteobacteria bacterium]|nr:MAG: hypothetical protein DRG30_08110 [Campylobacterota bacterium]